MEVLTTKGKGEVQIQNRQKLNGRSTSDFVSGIRLIEFNGEMGKDLLEFGHPEAEPIRVVEPDTIESRWTGLFSLAVYYRFSHGQNLLLIFDIFPRKSVLLFSGYLAMLLSIVFLSWLYISSAERRESKKRESLVAAMARQVAHDIRSPLSALAVVSSRLEGLPEDQKDLVVKATERIREIADDLLSRGKSPAEGPDVSHAVSAVVRDIIKEKAAEFAAYDGVEIIEDVREEAQSCRVAFDRKAFSRALSNLVNNSVEALPQGRGRVRVSVRKYPKEIAVTVSDNGIGMSPEMLEQVGRQGVSFGKPGGSGLGIFQAKGFAEASGGRFEVQSMLGEGTIAVIYFPLGSA